MGCCGRQSDGDPLQVVVKGCAEQLVVERHADVPTGLVYHLCVCVCVCERESVCVHVCVSVRMGESEMDCV